MILQSPLHTPPKLITSIISRRTDTGASRGARGPHQGTAGQPLGRRAAAHRVGRLLQTPPWAGRGKRER